MTYKDIFGFSICNLVSNGTSPTSLESVAEFPGNSGIESTSAAPDSISQFPGNAEIES